MLGLYFMEYFKYFYISGSIIMGLLSIYGIYLAIVEKTKMLVKLIIGSIILTCLSWIGLLVVIRYGLTKEVKKEDVGI